MKKRLLWMLATILVICGTTTVMTSCNDDDMEDIMENLNIVGQWKSLGIVSPQVVEGVTVEMSDITEFKTDGTYVSIDEDGEQTIGTWVLRNKTLTLTQTEEGQTINIVYVIKEGWTRDKIVMFTTFTGEDENGNTITYTLTVTMNRLK